MQVTSTLGTPYAAFPFLDFVIHAKPRVLAFGSRDWPAPSLVRDNIAALNRVIGDFTLVHGGARGVDLYADDVAVSLGLEVECYPADWNNHGRGAGPIRNKEMLDSGINYALGWILNGSRGSEDMLMRLNKTSVPTLVSRLETYISHDFPEI